jgi:hypothetical protein
MPDRSKGMDRTKYSPRSSSLGIGRGANDHTPEKLNITKLLELMRRAREETKTHTQL